MDTTAIRACEVATGTALIMVILNASPAMALPAELIEHTDVLMVNEHEPAALGNHDLGDTLIAVTYGAGGAALWRNTGIR